MKINEILEVTAASKGECYITARIGDKVYEFEMVGEVNVGQEVKIVKNKYGTKIVCGDKAHPIYFDIIEEK